MPLPEGYLPREGDIVALRGVVKWDVDAGDSRVHVKVDGNYSTSISVNLKDVDLVRRNWNAGEKVQMAVLPGLSYPAPGTVISTNPSGYVWVQYPNDDEPITIHANKLIPWVDPNAPLIPDEDAIRAMAEPPPPAAPLTEEQLDAILNAPEADVTVKADGSCEPSEKLDDEI